MENSNPHGKLSDLRLWNWGWWCVLTKHSEASRNDWLITSTAQHVAWILLTPITIWKKIRGCEEEKIVSEVNLARKEQLQSRDPTTVSSTSTSTSNILQIRKRKLKKTKIESSLKICSFNLSTSAGNGPAIDDATWILGWPSILLTN